MIKYARKAPYLQLLAAMAVLLLSSANGQAQTVDTGAASTKASEAQSVHEAVHKAEQEAAVERAIAAEVEAKKAAQQARIAEAQRQVEAASRAMAEAAKSLEAQRTGEQADLAAARAEAQAELSRAHRALSEASREIARAHREMERAQKSQSRVRVINLGDNAVIGVLLGESSERGVTLAGVSPGGPAEQAGLKKGDVLTSIREVDLTDQPENAARDALIATMAEVKPGEEIRIGFVRDGKSQKLMVKAEQREPSSWQSLIRFAQPPAAPGAPAVPGAPQAPAVPGAPGQSIEKTGHIVIRKGDGPDSETTVMAIDEAELADRIAEIEDRVDSLQYMFIDDDGTRIEFDQDFTFDGEQFSRLGEDALHLANMWFGLPQAAGLELASLNPELGSYFKTERGVLVLTVNADNSYGLNPGDVILEVAGAEVNTPAELIRALRNFEPGDEFEMQIKRERRDKTLKAVLPDSRLGALMGFKTTPQ